MTLQGESRAGTRLEFARANTAPRDPLGVAVLNLGPTAHDFVLENLTVKGRPRLVLRAGGEAGYASGSGSTTLQFALHRREPSDVLKLDLAGGAIVASHAFATLRVADLALP